MSIVNCIYLLTKWLALANCYRKFDRTEICQKMVINRRIRYMVKCIIKTILSSWNNNLLSTCKASGGTFTFRKYRSIRIPEGCVLFHSQHHYPNIISSISSKFKILQISLTYRKFRCLSENSSFSPQTTKVSMFPEIKKCLPNQQKFRFTFRMFRYLHTRFSDRFIVA